MSFLVFTNFSYPERFASQSKPSAQWKLQPHLQRDNNSKPKKKEGKRWREIEEKKEWRGRFVSTLHAWACLFDHAEFQPFRWLECVGQASNAFPRHHHNSRHSWGSADCGDICTTTLVTSSPPSLPHHHPTQSSLLHTALLKQTHTCTRRHWHTRTHSQLLQLNANEENQKGIRDGCCLRTPMCGFAWMGPKGGEVSDTTGCTLLGPLGCVTMVGGLSGWQTQGFQPERPPGIPRRLVTPQWRGWARWPLSLSERSRMCPLCPGFCINFTYLHSMDLTGFLYKA